MKNYKVGRRLSVFNWNNIFLILTLSMLMAVFGCGSGGGGDSDSGDNGGGGSEFSLSIGSWSGDDISFAVTDGSHVSNLSVTFRGHADGNICNYDYEQTSTLGAQIEVTNNTFNYVDANLTIIGEFLSETSAKVDVSWSNYDSHCQATESGTAYLFSSFESGSGGNSGGDDIIALEGGYIQYRSYPDGSNSYRGWIDFSNNGEPGNASDITQIQIKNSSGGNVQISDFDYYQDSSFYGNWDDTTSSVDFSGPFSFSGFSIRFPSGTNLASGNYTYEVTTSGGELLTMTRYFPGETEMPIVDRASMTMQELPSGDNYFSWDTPAGGFDEYRITYQDQSYSDLLYVTLPTDANDLTVPKSLIDQINDLKNPTTVHWEVQTRAYSEDGRNNYGRGYSGTFDF